VRLQEQRVDAQADRIEAELRLGRGLDVISDLDALAAAHPLRERFAGQLMRAMAATGRTAEALAVFDRLPDRLADELGVDPGSELQALQLAVLRGEIPAETTAPAAAGRRRSNLRASLTSFIGRDTEVARVSGLLETGRLVTIVGPGGAGKTRLASEIARRWIPRRSDGVWIIELAPVTDEKAIAQAVLGALGPVDTRAVERRVHDVTVAYPTAIGTEDMPIVAAVGVSVAWLAEALGRPEDAAAVLGAAAKLRGSADPGDPVIRELTSRLRGELADAFDEAFERGRLLDRPAAIGRIDPALLAVPDPDQARPR